MILPEPASLYPIPSSTLHFEKPVCTDFETHTVTLSSDRKGSYGQVSKYNTIPRMWGNEYGISGADHGLPNAFTRLDSVVTGC